MLPAVSAIPGAETREAGIAAGAVAGAAPFAFEALPGAAEAVLSHAEEQTAAWAAKYPHLVAIGAKLGVPAATAALFGWMMHSAKGVVKSDH